MSTEEKFIARPCRSCQVTDCGWHDTPDNFKLCEDYKLNLECTNVIEREKAIIIPEGATNGDMIKAMFPYGKYGTNGDYVHVYGVGGNGCLTFTLEWWNAPYKKEEAE